MAEQVTITLTRYAEPDDLVSEAIRHLTCQTGISGEILFIDQDERSTLSESDFPSNSLPVRVIRNKLKGLSAARNLAMDEARYTHVLFVDADAMADSEWARNLSAALDAPLVAVAGCRIVPRWSGPRPLFARSGVLRDQLSLLDLGPETCPYHRVVGAGFGVDMAKLSDLRFDENLGRREGILFGGEDTEFCAKAVVHGYSIVYVGAATVEHCIAPERMRWQWILKRMVYAGHGRARVGGAPAPSDRRSAADWLMLPLYLPPYAAGWLWGKLGGKPK